MTPPQNVKKKQRNRKGGKAKNGIVYFNSFTFFYPKYINFVKNIVFFIAQLVIYQYEYGLLFINGVFLLVILIHFYIFQEYQFFRRFYAVFKQKFNQQLICFQFLKKKIKKYNKITKKKKKWKPKTKNLLKELFFPYSTKEDSNQEENTNLNLDSHPPYTSTSESSYPTPTYYKMSPPPSGTQSNP